MTPKSITNGTNLAQGEGKGVPENQRKSEKLKNAKVKKQNKKNLFLSMWGEFLKSRRAQRLGIYCGIIDNCDKQCI